MKAKNALNLKNYIEYIVCKDYRLGCEMAPITPLDDSFIKVKDVNNAILMDALSSSSNVTNSAPDLRGRLIALHLAIEDRYPVLEKEGDIEGFEICMKYQDKIYLLVCPDDPEPNADIRRPLLTALTLAHYVDCEEYSAQSAHDLISNLDDESSREEDSSREEKWSLEPADYTSLSPISSVTQVQTLSPSPEKDINGLLLARYDSLQKNRDLVGCGIILRYQDKIRLLSHSE